MTLPVGSPGRQARLRGIAQSLRRYLAECDDKAKKVWKVSEDIGADRSLLTGEHGVIKLHRSWDDVDDAWFDTWTADGEDSTTEMVALTTEGEQISREESYGIDGVGKGSAVATDGGSRIEK